MGDIFWIGDIHGCAKTLNALLKQIPEGAKVGFLGDVIDRGPDSLGAIETIMAIENRVCLYGNHEIMMAEALFNSHNVIGNMEMWSRNGGHAVLAQLKEKDDEDKKERYLSLIREYINQCQTFFVADSYVCAHAGLPCWFDPKSSPHFYPLEEGDEFIWTQSLIETMHLAEKMDKRVILGHHWNHGDIAYQNKNQPVLVIDTSCVAGGCLTAYNPVTGEMIQQENID